MKKFLIIGFVVFLGSYLIRDWFSYLIGMVIGFVIGTVTLFYAIKDAERKQKEYQKEFDRRAYEIKNVPRYHGGNRMA